MSGLMDLTGDPQGSPTYVGIYVADENAGIHGLAAVCAALYYREKTGVGQYIDLSLVESLFHFKCMRPLIACATVSLPGRCA